MKEAALFGIAAHGSGRGKTRLMLVLLKEFCARGVEVAVLKHGQHITLPPDKDSSLFMQAGAASSLVVSPQGWLLCSQPQQEPDFVAALTLLQQSCPAQLLLVEGYKQGPQPKLLLTEECLREEELLPHTRAIISDTAQNLPLPCFGSGEAVKIADFIVQSCEMEEN